MKNYTITVNGNVYDVSVEETGASAAGTSSAPAASAPKAAPKKAASAGAGGIKITAGAAGKVFKCAANVGASVKKGDPVVILEVMKMETPVVAPEDGVVKSIDVTEGSTVEAGALLATMDKA